MSSLLSKKQRGLWLGVPAIGLHVTSCGRRFSRRLVRLFFYVQSLSFCLPDLLCSTAEKGSAEERAAKLEEELNGLRKELEDRQAEEERVARARNTEATRLRSLASALSG